MNRTDELQATASIAGVDEALIERASAALHDHDTAGLIDLMAPLHPADQATLLHSLPPVERQELARLAARVIEPETLNWLDVDVREEILDALGPEAVALAVAELESDDAVEIIEDLDEEDRSALLDALPAEERAQLEQVLAYPDYSAARLLRRDAVSLPDYWTVGQAIDHFRLHAADLPDEFPDVLIVDPRMRPVGQVHTSQILKAARDVPMSSLRLKELVQIDATTDQEEVARIFKKYGLSSAPVVDQLGRLMGVITVDDIIEVVEEEAEDDLLKLGGVVDSDRYQDAWRTMWHRLPWLAVNLLTAILASMVIDGFEDSIAALTALAVLMPMVASMGGNAGTQTLTVTVRVLALADLSKGAAARLILKETLVGFLNGGAFLVIGTLTALVWFWQPALALVFGAAMLINLAMAGIAGVTIPLFLRRLGYDPAVSSTVFVTTVTDVVGFFGFLGLATLFLL